MANLLVAQLLYLDSASQEKDITMYVNSPGGSVTAGGCELTLKLNGSAQPQMRLTNNLDAIGTLAHRCLSPSASTALFVMRTLPPLVMSK